MQRTARCARKIGAFLKVGIGPTPVLIYECAAADAQPVRRPGSVVGAPFSLWIGRIAFPEGTLCQIRRADARCAGVIRRRVVRIARGAERGT